MAQKTNNILIHVLISILSQSKPNVKKRRDGFN